jgi:hypothetical protein
VPVASLKYPSLICTHRRAFNAVVFLKNTTALKMAGKKYHGEGKIAENHNICGTPPKKKQNNFSVIWAISCNLRTSDPIFREKCCLKKSRF